MSRFQIMDVTLRDGSYQINFQFSNADVRRIGGELDKLGIPFIEIGHVQVIGASEAGQGKAVQTDEEYLAEAKRSIRQAKVGMFCIPGIATLGQLERMCDQGLDFVRVGTNVDQVEESRPFIELAKRHGLVVMANYMKSYACTPEEFAGQVLKSQDYGADYVYVVDSAGSMLPETLQRYYEAIRKKSDIALGYHGHDNLGMAVANSIYAAELGFELVDASLQGLGRSAGNAVLERFVAVAQKLGYYQEIDIKKLLWLGYEYVARFTDGHAISPIDTICGVAGFHSSYLPVIHRCSGMYDVDPLALIEIYAKEDQLNMDEERLARIAQQLPRNQQNDSLLNMSRFLINEQKPRG